MNQTTSIPFNWKVTHSRRKGLITNVHTYTLSRFSRVQLCATPWTIARHVPLSMGISQAKIMKQVAIFSSRGIPNPGIEPMFPAWQVDFFFFLNQWTTLETPEYTFKKTCRTASGGKYLRPLLSPSPEFNSFHFYLSVGLRIERESWNLSLPLQRERRKDKRVKGKEIFYKKQLE